MANRLTLGSILTLALLFLSPHLAQAAPAALSPSIWEANDLPSLLTPRYNRFEPGTLTDRLLEQARHYLHSPYHRGGSLQTGRTTDCSGFVQYIYKKADIDLPRASAAQAQAGQVAARRLDFSKLAVGDLLFFKDGGRRIGHVGIYLGEGKMIHASSHRRGVTVSDLHEGYYQGAFVVAKRLLEGPNCRPASPTKPSARPVVN